MPASAQNGATDSAAECPAATARVIDLASRRRSPAEPGPVSAAQKPPLEDGSLVAEFAEQMPDGSEEDQRASISAMWHDVVAAQGTSLADPAVAAAVVGVAEALERLLYAAQVMRYGDPNRVPVIAPNEQDGLDHVGAQVMLDLMHGLRNAARDARPEQQQRM